jgi:hypothetical protein
MSCKAEKEGYHDNGVTVAVEDDVEVRIELVTKEPSSTVKNIRRDNEGKPLEIRVHLQDREGRPVTGVTVMCEKDDFETFTGVSDERGTVRAFLRRISET